MLISIAISHRTAKIMTSEFLLESINWHINNSVSKHQQWCLDDVRKIKNELAKVTLFGKGFIYEGF